jgi:hypothetical protein
MILMPENVKQDFVESIEEAMNQVGHLVCLMMENNFDNLSDDFIDVMDELQYISDRVTK